MKNEYFQKLIADLLQTPTSFVLLLIILVFLIIVLDAITALAKKNRLQTGISKKILNQTALSTKTLPQKTYISEIQGLSGKPDALIVENNYVIPVERKAFANKIRDRYVAQILVYMRLIAEFEGKEPPYGYLILGKNNRRVKILNTPQKQLWLQEYIDGMKAILNNEKTVIPKPEKRKCFSCVVNSYCEFSLGTR